VTCDAPLYIQPHSKLVLSLAIEKDTQFLLSQAVMDYSLLVGFDEERKELVIGIIGKFFFFFFFTICGFVKSCRQVLWNCTH
jgi:hypothetical protein